MCIIQTVCVSWWSGLIVVYSFCIITILTLGADASEVSDLHQHAGEHVWFVGASATGVDLQGLQQGLLQLVHLLGLLQVHTV